MKSNYMIRLGIATLCLIGFGTTVEANSEAPRFIAESKVPIQKATSIATPDLAEIKVNEKTTAVSQETFTNTINQVNSNCPFNHENCDGIHQNQTTNPCPYNHENCDGTHVNQTTNPCSYNHENCDGTHGQHHQNNGENQNYGHNGRHGNHH